MSLSEKYQADPTKAETGVEIQIDDMFFTMVYYNSTIVQASFQMHLEKFKLEHDAKKAVILAMQEVLVEDVVLSWRNVKETKDSPELEYSKDNLRMLLKKYSGFDAELMAHSNDISYYRRELKEEILKNS